MSFRDDHEAAVARIAALEQQLAATRNADYDQSVEVSRLQAENAQLRHKLGPPPSSTRSPDPPKQRVATWSTPRVEREPFFGHDNRYRSFWIGYAIFVGILLVVFVCLAHL